jgi:2,3-dihydroxy-p-cumate/2,3-dihydroxybenzoate 3,4-dioxygenase
MMEQHMIAIEQLRYVRLGIGNLPSAVDFAKRILGLELVDQDDDQALFRSDFRDHTLAFVKGAGRAQSIGFELRDTKTLERAADALARHGYDINPGTPDAAAKRRVKSFLSFKDEAGISIELVVRPLHSGWRYFPSRDAGITGLEAVALRSPAIARCEALWTRLLSGKVSDWIGDAAFIRLDATHHRLALYPAPSGGVLAVEFGVEGVDQLMQSSYFLQDKQVRIVHGPGRRPASGQMFLTFTGPDGVLFSYVAEGRPIVEGQHRPRQFPRRAQSFCAWGNRSEVPEFKCEDCSSTTQGARR